MTEEHGAQEIYKPSPEVIAAANVKSYEELAREANEDLAGFWAEQARQFVWFKEWDQILDESNKPFYKWFVGGKTNIVYNCLDRHVKTWRRNKLALIWEGEDGERRAFSYYALNREVGKFSNVLRSMGVQKGDRVTIYMGRVPELPIAMLACAKIGAVHSVVYGGFSVEALHGRIEDSESKVVITCDGGFMRGKIFQPKLKIIVQTRFIVIDKHRCGDMHGVAQQQALTDPALSKAFLHLRGDVAKLPTRRDIKPEFFTI